MAKRLVACCDGTWNTPDQVQGGTSTATNVTKVALGIAAKDENDIEQLVFYDKGVGTGKLDHLRGGALGWGLSENVKQAFIFLIRNYNPGDEVFLFGFSRGAYTARSVAGLIRNSGLLRRKNEDKLDQAYSLYRDRSNSTHPRSTEAQLFRKSYSHEIRIKFIGVWDTVGALGIPNLGSINLISNLWTFHDVALSSYVDNAFQALAIDEHRKPFVPTLWEKQESAINQRLEQVWFAGVHTNIGGGYPDSGLSDIALDWMIVKARDCGLAVNIEIKPNALGKIRDSMTWYYRLLGEVDRPIDERKPDSKLPTIRCEAVHPSALERFNAPEVFYGPKNLATYLSKHPVNSSSA
jgi:uncharacterized protein (DUF2235 family)